MRAIVIAACLALAACSSPTPINDRAVQAVAEKAVATAMASAFAQAVNDVNRAPTPPTPGTAVTLAELPEPIRARYGHEAALVAGDGTITRYVASDGAPVFYWRRPNRVVDGRDTTYPDTVLVESCASYRLLTKAEKNYWNLWCVRE